MDASVRHKAEEIMRALEGEQREISMADPVAKMLLVALAHQSDELGRKIDSTVSRVAANLCREAILGSEFRPLPALSVLKIGNGPEYTPYRIDEKVEFTYPKTKCCYRALFPALVVPGDVTGFYCDGSLHYPMQEPVEADEPLHDAELWVAYSPANDVETLENVVIAVNHPLGDGSPVTARVGDVTYPLIPVSESVAPWLEGSYMLTEYWRRHLVFMRLWLYRFGAPDVESPLLTEEMPGWFLDMYEPETLSPFSGRRHLWIRITSPGLSVPDDSHIEFNCLPVANYDIHTVKLSYTEPMRPLDNPKTGAQFFELIEDPEQTEDYFVRDFDIDQYDDRRIAEDIRNLYDHYVDDYYAFVDNNSLNDGAVLRSLRQSMLQVVDSIPSSQTSKTYAGSYLIRSPKNSGRPVVVKYLTTQGARGNLLKEMTKLTCSYAAPGAVVALIGAEGGRDKISGQTGLHEQAAFTLASNDRLFTDIDIRRYCRLEFLRALGETAMRYCTISLTHGSRPVGNHIERCVTVTFAFTSETHYRTALELNFAQYLRTNIEMRKSFTENINVNIRML